jgi:serine/threonine protein phosphatase 1
MSKTWVIGDLHGAHKALLQCFERSGFDKEKDTLISIGDIADGWSQVPECVEELLTIKNLIAIRGNHDIWCWNWFNYGEQPIMWTQQGGQATITAYIEQGLLMDANHRNFWNNQIDYYIDDENRLFVHGGFDLYYGFSWSKSAKVGVKNATELHWNRDLADFNVKSWSKKAIAFLDEFKEIFIGHTAHDTTNFNTKSKHNIWNVDSGAGWKGKLTIMDVQSKEYFQSDNVQLLYKNERGRD